MFRKVYIIVIHQLYMANKDLKKLKDEIKKIGKYKTVAMNIGFGQKEYSIFRNYGGEWGSARPVKYYKTEAGALREIKKKMERDKAYK